MNVSDEAVEGRSPMAQFQDALGDYYDAGMIGAPPKLEDFTPDEGLGWRADERHIRELLEAGLQHAMAAARDEGAGAALVMDCCANALPCGACEACRAPNPANPYRKTPHGND